MNRRNAAAATEVTQRVRRAGTCLTEELPSENINARTPVHQSHRRRSMLLPGTNAHVIPPMPVHLKGRSISSLERRIRYRMLPLFAEEALHSGENARRAEGGITGTRSRSALTVAP